MIRHKLKFISLSLPLIFSTIAATAQETPKAPVDADAWSYWPIAFFVLAIVFFIVVALVRTTSAFRNESSASSKSWWASLTKAVPVEKEEGILLDHEYDGIRELDNALPPWWKYGFYITIGVAALYLLRFHVLKTGPDPIKEYDQEMKVAAAEVEEYRKKTGDMVDEKTVTMADAAGIAEGDKIFHSNCFACHGPKGEGGVGPNLTDNYWLHGGTLNEVFKTIKYGVPEKGMQAWEKTYSPSQIKSLASYIKTLAGTNPPNGKAPQGDPMQDSTKPVGKDSAAVAVSK